MKHIKSGPAENKHFKEYNYDFIATELINQAESPYSVNKTKSVPLLPRRGSQLSDEYDRAEDDQPFRKSVAAINVKKQVPTEETPRLEAVIDDKKSLGKKSSNGMAFTGMRPLDGKPVRKSHTMRIHDKPRSSVSEPPETQGDQLMNAAYF